MKSIKLAMISASTIMLMAATGVAAPAAPMKSIPSGAVTVTDWYRQDVYDVNNAKLGEIKDVLLDKSGRANTLIVGVGGLLGADEKDVAVPFEAVQVKANGDEKGRLIMDATVDQLKAGPTYTYDRSSTSWVPTTH